MQAMLDKEDATLKTNNNTNASITDLIKYTPKLGRYVVANILTKYGKPHGYEGKHKFILYKGWIKNNEQIGRVNFYHKRFCKKFQAEVVTITSYFIQVGIREIGIHLPNNNGKTPDIYIDYPTKG
jgi:hypothetical protein|tara:strand:+ start:1573 stop:1947 length:375 start_codon:yes stop_codon:yes gene_type:complete